MKKILFITSLMLCLCMGAFAQQQRQPGQRGGNQMRAQRQMDAVVDTAVINHMDLEQALLDQVYALQNTKQAELRESMQQTRQRGQRWTEEQRKEMMEQRAAFNQQYRKELRTLLGDETYILYLEKLLDHQSHARFNGMGGQPRPGQAEMHQRGAQRQAGWGDDNNGFGGGDF